MTLERNAALLAALATVGSLATYASIAAAAPPAASPAAGTEGPAASAASSWLEPRPGVAKGKVEAFTLADAHDHRSRKVSVYTPPGYDPKAAEPYGLAIFLDGPAFYIEEIPAPTILDNLEAAGAIRPLVALFVDSSEDRPGDLANRAAFAGFLGDELVPWVRKGWRVSSDPARTIVCGASAGGLGAAFAAFRRPDLFGNVLSQSGAFWRGPEGRTDDLEWLTAQLRKSPRLPIRFVVEVGETETHATAAGPIFIETNRRLRDVLVSKGYDVRYREIPGGRHSPATWGPALPDALIHLAGTPAAAPR